MKELKYIRKVAEAHPYDYEQPPICKVELWDFSHANENDEARKEAVCLVASISYGNEYCKDPERLWNLLIEKGHESPLEFVKDWIKDKEVWDLRNREFPTWEDDIRENYHGEDYTDGAIYMNRKYFATFKLKVPIFVARQIQRHRAFSYMEMSRRYVKGDRVKFEFWNPVPEDITIEIIHPLCPEGKTRQNWEPEDFYRFFYDYCCDEYIGSLKAKPEQARAFLPLGLYTQFWMQGDYKAWLNFFIHRLHPEAQEETRLVAQAMWNLLKEHQPEIVKTMINFLNLEEWIRNCNPMFAPAREKKAEWFTKNFLASD